jgi:hypothetical protein
MGAQCTNPPAADGEPNASPAEALAEPIAKLRQLSPGELRSEWRRRFRTQPPNLSRDLLVRAIAYRLQALAHGGLPKAAVRKLATLAQDFKADAVDTSPQIKIGARLVREWHGRTHVVTVTEDGFEYAGRSYPSLTTIARAITSAHWSGPRFFGFKDRKRQPAAGRSNPPGLPAHLASSDVSGEAGHA